MRSTRRSRNSLAKAVLEVLEGRLLMSAAFDITSLTAMREDPTLKQINGAGVGIAVLDTGVFAQNPDLSSNVVAFYNAVTDPVNTPNISVGGAVDNDGHGSHVSGIAASSNSAIGVAYGAKLVDIKVLSDVGEAQLGGDPLLRGLQWVAANYLTYNIKVVNMSLGEPGINDNTITPEDRQDSEAQEITTLEGDGITVVTASGNSYANDPTPGASFPAIVSTISVANTWADSGQAADFGVPFGGAGDIFYAIDNKATPDTLASTSQRSTLPNQVAAPGEDIYSTWNGTIDESNGSDLLHNTISGTSMASPFVSGVVALMQQTAKVFGGHYLSDPTQIRQIIQQTADTVIDSNNPDNQRYDSFTGGTSNLPETGLSFKRVNVLNAIRAVVSLVTGGSVISGPTPGPDTDNTTTTATPVNNVDGTSVFTFDGNIGQDGLVLVGNKDVDLYKINVVSPGALAVSSTLPAGGIAFPETLTLFDSSGTVIAQSVGSALAYPTVSTPGNSLLPVGTYYLGVSNSVNKNYTINGTGNTGGGAEGDYSIQISLANPDPNGTPQGASSVDLTLPTEILTDPLTGHEYTDLLEQGTLGSDPPPAGSTTRTIVDSDIDVFKMIAPDSGVIDISTDTSAYLNPADTYIMAFDSNLNSLGSNNNANQFTSDSSLTINVTAGQTYYVAVTVPANAQFDPANPFAHRVPDATPTNQGYDLHLRFDNGDANGTAITAAGALIGTPSQGVIGSDNNVALLGANGGNKDVDFITYTADSNGFIDVTATSNTPGFTPVLSLWEFNTGGTDIVKVADTSGLATPELIAPVSAGVSFFVAVTGQGNNDFNWFALGSGSGGQTGRYTVTTALRSASDLISVSDNSIHGGTPTPLAFGVGVKGNLGMDSNIVVGASDVDMYSFTATADQVIDVRTSTNQEGDADTVLRVFDANGSQIAFNDNLSSSTTASDVRFVAAAGQTYYVGVSGAGINALSYNPLNGVGAGKGSTGNYTITANIVQPGLAITANGPAIGFAPNTADFTVTLDEALTTPVTVNYATADGSAVAGTDYTATNGTLTFAPGVTTQTIHVPALLDSAHLGSLAFTVNLSSPSGAPIDTATATGTVLEEALTTIPFGAGKSAVYTDVAGKKVTVSLKGAGSGEVVFVGAQRTPAELRVDGSVASSTLTISGGGVIVDAITVNGSLASLTAKTTSLVGAMSVSGSLGKLLLGNITGQQAGQAITIGASAGPMSVTLGDVRDEGLSTPGAIALLSVRSWTSSGAVGTATISAASIASIKSAKDFNPNLTVTGAIGTVTIGGSVTASTWAAASIGKATIKTSLFQTNITLSGTGADLTNLTVGKLVNATHIRTGGNVGKVTVGAFIGSTLLAGVNDSVTTLPATAADLSANNSILSFTVKGTQPTSFNNSDVAASSLGKVSIARASGSNGGVKFGFAAKSIASFSNKGVLKWKAGEAATLLVPDGDLIVRLLT